MSSLPIYAGQWTDWSDGVVLGNYRTYSREETQYIIGGTSAFLTYVGGCTWLIFAFFIHQRLATNSTPDLVTLQHRSIYRNDSTAQAALVDGFWVYWAWKPWERLWPPRRRDKRARNLGRRTCALMLPALLLFAIFAVASVLSTRIATPIYRGNSVLLSDGFSQNQCGITLFDGSLESQPDSDVKAANDTHAAVSYARSCYSSVTGVLNSVSCSSFVTAKLKYTSEASECPFGDPTRPFNMSICNFNNNNEAYRVSTALLDSHDDFGINARPGDRVKLLKQLTCSPLSQKSFTSTEQGSGTEANTTLIDYNYGGIPNYESYTYQYNPAAINDNVPFEIYTIYHNGTGPALWRPVPNISRTDADVTIIFVAPNSITYRGQVIDPFFQATYTSTSLAMVPGNITVYTPDYPVSVMGCVEQYSLCKDEDHCTKLGGQEALCGEILGLDLNAAQFVAAQRMIYMIAYANTYSSINGIGPDALRLWSQVYNFVSPAIPPNQWKIEVEGWFETTLAKWQSFMVEFAINTADPGSHGHIGFPITNSTLAPFWRTQCKNQKISNLGGYQNVSIFGLAFTWAVGGFLVVLSWSLRKCVSQQRKWTGQKSKPDPEARRISWNIDGKLQQHRVALLSVGYKELKGGEGDVPYLEKKPNLPLPFKATVDETDGDTRYESCASRPRSDSLRKSSNAETEDPKRTMPQPA